MKYFHLLCEYHHLKMKINKLCIVSNTRTASHAQLNSTQLNSHQPHDYIISLWKMESYLFFWSKSSCNKNRINVIWHICAYGVVLVVVIRSSLGLAECHSVCCIPIHCIFWISLWHTASEQCLSKLPWKWSK